MLTARMTFGLGGLLLVNVVLLAVQMVVGVSYLPIRTSIGGWRGGDQRGRRLANRSSTGEFA